MAKPDAIPWVEKYRPNSLDEILSQTDAIQIITRYIKNDQLPHLLLHGPPGTGKTSTILAMCRLLYGESSKASVLELNASDDRGIMTVREQIKTFAESKSSFSTNKAFQPDMVHENSVTFKLIILDEADQMTSAAQNALRRIMEQYSENVRFCITCNYVNKIHPAIQSRCTGFRFPPLLQEEIRLRVMQIAHQENLDLTDDGLDALLAVGQGDMRRILNSLQMAAMSNPNKVLSNDVILTTLGRATRDEIDQSLQWLMELPFEQTHNSLHGLIKTKGYSIQTFLTDLYNKILTIDWPTSVIIELIIHLANIEERLSVGSNDEIQMCAIISAFVNARAELHQLEMSKK